jgi:hypothetical protein
MKTLGRCLIFRGPLGSGCRSAKESNAMTTITTPSSLALVSSLETAWQDVDSSFERFCLTAGNWELDDAEKAEGLLRNLARRLDQQAPGVAASILEGLDETKFGASPRALCPNLNLRVS